MKQREIYEVRAEVYGYNMYAGFDMIEDTGFGLCETVEAANELIRELRSTDKEPIKYRIERRILFC